MCQQNYITRDKEYIERRKRNRTAQKREQKGALPPIRNPRTADSSRTVNICVGQMFCETAATVVTMFFGQTNVLLPAAPNTAFRETSQRIRTYLCSLIRVILIPFQCVCFTQFSTHQYNISTHQYNISTHQYNISTHQYNISTHQYNISTHQYNIHSPPNIIRMNKQRRMGRAGHVARMGDSRGAHRVLMVRHEGKKPLRIPRR